MSLPNRTPLTEQQQRLAADPVYIRQARRIAAMWAKHHPWLAEDIQSAALLGLVKAARGFAPNRGCDFRTYLGHKVRSEVLDLIRGQKQLQGYRRKLHDGAPVRRPLLATTEAFSEDLPVGWEIESEDAIHALTQHLPVGPKRAIRLRFARAAGASNVAAGRALGLHETRISQLVNEGLRLIRERVGVA